MTREYHKGYPELGIREILSLVAFFDSTGFLFFFCFGGGLLEGVGDGRWEGCLDGR